MMDFFKHWTLAAATNGAIVGSVSLLAALAMHKGVRWLLATRLAVGDVVFLTIAGLFLVGFARSWLAAELFAAVVAAFLLSVALGILGRVEGPLKDKRNRVAELPPTRADDSDIKERHARPGKTALLLIDVINDLEFDQGKELLRFALPMAKAIAALARRARAADVPVVYVNDNFGHWRSDFRATIDHCLNDDVVGKPVAELLLPEKSDYFVLKPRHSGFYSTTLDTLLRRLEIETVIVTGMAGNICVLFTAYDAYLRGYRVVVPPDAIASNTENDTTHSLDQMRKVLKAETPRSGEIDFSQPPASTGES